MGARVWEDIYTNVKVSLSLGIMESICTSPGQGLRIKRGSGLIAFEESEEYFK